MQTKIQTAHVSKPVPPAALPTPVPTPTPAGGGIMRKIAFASNRADGRHYQIYMMDADGANVVRLTESASFDRDPHLSYDGRHLAFSSNRDKGVYQIFSLDLETRQARQLTFGPEDKTNPFWNPDNQQILFTIHCHGNSEIAIMSADGTRIRQLTSGDKNNHGYGFSPDGKTISFESTRNNRNELFLMDLDTLKTEALVTSDDVIWREDPVFSPQGQKLIFTSDALSHRLRQLYIYDLNWNKYYRISRDELDKDDPIFSPDGSHIAYVAKWENAWNIFVIDAEGEHVRNLTQSYYDNLVPSWR